MPFIQAGSTINIIIQSNGRIRKKKNTLLGFMWVYFLSLQSIQDYEYHASLSLSYNFNAFFFFSPESLWLQAKELLSAFPISVAVIITIGLLFHWLLSLQTITWWDWDMAQYRNLFSQIFFFSLLSSLCYFSFLLLFSFSWHFIATFSFFLMRCAISVLFLRILYKKKFDNVFGFHCSCTFIFIPYCGVCIPV